MMKRRPRSAWGGLAVLLTLAALLPVPAAQAEEKIHLERAKRIARDVRPAVVRIEWRPRSGDAKTVERHAIVIDPDGWLLMAGPGPAANGTLAATFEDGRATRAELWATDAETSLSLLRVPLTKLPPLSLRAPEAPEKPPEESGEPGSLRRVEMTPTRLPPGFPFLLVTAEGAFARGNLRGSHRWRSHEEPTLGARVVVRCLDEAVLSVVATDLGAPWVDEDGRVAGLLVGANIGTPQAGGDVADGVEMRPEVTAAHAVPAEVIRIVWPLLKMHRRVPRGVLGVRVRALSEAAQKHLCPGCGGFEVLDLAPAGAAQRAKVEIRDVILSVGGRRMAPDADLSDVLLPHRPGTRLEIGILRRGKPVAVEVVLGRGE